ncbi:uncharacterized protein Dana_GF15375, isoform A [Drosophila ananassae]|uniref:Uncharacterized protein, isoform A n=1 Tax=Drosophila ananassae TaxID=7217 RepID=B3MK55_DROAN|nr:uncharacterized protein LOC6498185 [Drosophila ananassae]EDV31473.1 uncharacterized protein Dana_GF15375, isoform A [Drosophila ananassae]
MSTKSMASNCSCSLLRLCLFVLLILPAALQAIRIPKNSSSNNVATASTSATSADNNAKAGSKYEIRGVAGEPNYRSVNLTWEVEFVPAAHDTDSSSTNTDSHSKSGSSSTTGQVNVTNMSVDVEPPRAFQIFYCEMQNYGPQRCRVKLVNGTAAAVSQEESQNEEENQELHDPLSPQIQHFATAVDNLRMATRYSFHIRPAAQRRLQASGTRSSNARSEFHDENEIESGSGHLPGQSIIIPTKGFSAHATQCLPHASEIEVETGPYFGGRIVVDGGNCGVKGDPSDSADKYTMRIDHKECGSLVKPETNTVETFITVQENLGIFTHSTRRFVVVCSYQSGMQTVRASFTVPGKNGVAAAYEPNDPFEPDDDQRLGRELRQMRYVNKSELVLREPNSQPEAESVEEAAVVQETQPPSTEQTATLRGQGRALNLNEVQHNVAVAVAEDEEPAEGNHLEPVVGTKYAKLVVDQAHSSWMPLEAGSPPLGGDNEDEAILRYIGSHLSSVLVTVSLSVIIISICIVLLQRQRIRSPHRSGAPSMANHLPHKTLPRALQHQQYQCTL